MTNGKSKDTLPATLGDGHKGLNRFLAGRVVSTGFQIATQLYDEVEQRALQSIKRKLDQVDSQAQEHDGSTLPQLLRPNAHGLLSELYQRSLNQTPDSAWDDLLTLLTQQLVPDELRVLAALADGDKHPACHLDAVNRLGTKSFRVRSYLSRTPQESGIMLPEMAPVYLKHLLNLGLLEAGPEVSGHTPRYDTIENGLDVRAAIADLNGNGSNLKPRFQRFSVRLSGLGQRFWEASLVARHSG
ncbi:Abi-alpha family protein [Marinobacter mobilis]|uniref:DUF4393 domain-containing protein n=1 Tax=Marinobacter mobilis TaxID=488533 RepID=A0A1H2Q0N1_9GAMM|nr:hypothetical protein [Marinobacter mobilis]SDW00079.1 hypothetical protein SAMN04487960_10142 [Marinobacter mobilis]